MFLNLQMAFIIYNGEAIHWCGLTVNREFSKGKLQMIVIFF